MANPTFGTPDDDDLGDVTASDPRSIYGLGGNDTLRGGSNSDLLDGGIGNDILIGASGHDHLVGAEGNDSTSGGPGDDWHEGGDGDDTLNDDAGTDTLDGGAGDDALTAGEGDDTLYAGTGKDYLSGGIGNDRLYADGSFANAPDVLSGGDGNDVYILSGANFVLLGPDAGLDRLEISVSFSIAGFADLEDLTLIGAGAINGIGNDRANTINGNDAANVLDGAGGNDLIRGYGGNDTITGGLGGGVEYLYGGTGDDTYVVMDLDDTPVDFAGEGTDTVQSSIRWVLGANLENLILTGTASVNGFGNGLANTLTGNAGNNYLQGFAGADILQGGAGNDYYELGDLSYSQLAGNKYDTVIEGVNAGIDTVSVTSIDNPDFFGTSGYTLGANIENGIIVGGLAFNLAGNALNNSLTGNDAANRLTGNEGSDTLDGRAGLDTLTGGAGDDYYILNDLTLIDEQSGFEYDSVVEAANGGTDTVLVSQQGNDRYYLGANVENLVVTGASGLSVVANDLVNSLIGNGGHNLFYGLGGADTLDGGGGADQLIGGLGDDTYILNDTYLVSGSLQFDGVGEAAGEGIDTVQVSSAVGRLTYVLDANVENAIATGAANFNLVGNGLNNVLTGNVAANVLTGDAGNDRLIGGTGVDTMIGGVGDDIYYIDSAGDAISEGAGQGALDWAATSVSYSLGAAVQVERLSTTASTGTAAIDLTGNAFVQTITGNAGANKLNGMAGADTMVGLAGNDTYYIDNAGDKVIEAANQGALDWVATSVSYALGVGVQVEKLSTISSGATAAIDLTGNEFAQSIIGNAGSNRLNGVGGADTMTGLGGNDIYYVDNVGDRVIEGAGQGTSDWVATSVNYILGAGVQVERLSTTSSGATTAINMIGNEFAQAIVGNAGANILSGKAGNDTLSGAGGSDVFVFDTGLNSTTNVDTITDYNVAADTIWLQNGIFTQIAGTGTLTSAQFVANSTGLAADANDRIIYEADTGKLFYDSNGNAAGGSFHFATLAAGLALTNADFYVI